MRAVLRRATPSLTSDGVLQVRDIVVDEAAFRASRGSQDVSLTATEFRMLHELARRAGSVLTRDVLLERIWGYDYLGDSRLVDMAILRLRENSALRCRVRHTSPPSAASDIGSSVSDATPSTPRRFRRRLTFAFVVVAAVSAGMLAIVLVGRRSRISLANGAIPKPGGGEVRARRGAPRVRPLNVRTLPAGVRAAQRRRHSGRSRRRGLRVRCEPQRRRPVAARHAERGPDADDVDRRRS